MLQPIQGMGRSAAQDASFMMAMMTAPSNAQDGVWESARQHLADEAARKPAPEWETGIAELCDPIGDTRLLLGTSVVHADRAALKEHGIVAIMTVGTSPQPCDASGVRKHSIQLGDLSSAPMLRHLPEAFEFIDGALKTGAVLITSEEDDGTEAAATAVVVGWLMAKQDVPWSDAPGVVKAHRKSGQLNKNFEKQLRVWSRWPEFPGLPDWVIDGF